MGRAKKNTAGQRESDKKKTVLLVINYSLIRGQLNRNHNKMKERIKCRKLGEEIRSMLVIQSLNVQKNVPGL